MQITQVEKLDIISIYNVSNFPWLWEELFRRLFQYPECGSHFITYLLVKYVRGTVCQFDVLKLLQTTIIKTNKRVSLISIKITILSHFQGQVPYSHEREKTLKFLRIHSARHILVLLLQTPIMVSPQCIELSQKAFKVLNLACFYWNLLVAVVLSP